MTRLALEMIAVIREYMMIAPAFESMPVGAPHSPARAEQDTHIALEDRARAVIAKAKGE